MADPSASRESVSTAAAGAFTLAAMPGIIRGRGVARRPGTAGSGPGARQRRPALRRPPSVPARGAWLASRPGWRRGGDRRPTPGFEEPDPRRPPPRCQRSSISASASAASPSPWGDRSACRDSVSIASTSGARRVRPTVAAALRRMPARRVAVSMRQLGSDPREYLDAESGRIAANLGVRGGCDQGRPPARPSGCGPDRTATRPPARSPATPGAVASGQGRAARRAGRRAWRSASSSK